MNKWKKHHRSIQKKNKKAINPSLPEDSSFLAALALRGIPAPKELEQHFKDRVRINPKKFL